MQFLRCLGLFALLSLSDCVDVAQQTTSFAAQSTDDLLDTLEAEPAVRLTERAQSPTPNKVNTPHPQERPPDAFVFALLALLPPTVLDAARVTWSDLINSCDPPHRFCETLAWVLEVPRYIGLLPEPVANLSGRITKSYAQLQDVRFEDYLWDAVRALNIALKMYEESDESHPAYRVFVDKTIGVAQGFSYRLLSLDARSSIYAQFKNTMVFQTYNKGLMPNLLYYLRLDAQYTLDYLRARAPLTAAYDRPIDVRRITAHRRSFSGFRDASQDWVNDYADTVIEMYEAAEELSPHFTLEMTTGNAACYNGDYLIWWLRRL